MGTHHGAGATYEIRPTGPVDIRRIEGGIFNWGADMTYENNPYELGLDRLVDLDSDADFVAREALTRVRQDGVKQKIVGLEIDGDRIEMNATTWPASANGAIGRVTSAVYSPRLETKSATGGFRSSTRTRYASHGRDALRRQERNDRAPSVRRPRKADSEVVALETASGETGRAEKAPASKPLEGFAEGLVDGDVAKQTQNRG